MESDRKERSKENAASGTERGRVGGQVRECAGRGPQGGQEEEEPQWGQSQSGQGQEREGSGSRLWAEGGGDSVGVQDGQLGQGVGELILVTI